MNFRVLGPVGAAAEDGAELPVGGPKQRSVLALLLVKADRVVDTDFIVEELYPEGGSGANRKTVQVYVSRLRSGLAQRGNGDVIEHRANGYEIAVDGHTLDSQQFETLLRRGRSLIATDADAASQTLQQCLALWRGRPFEDAFPTPELELEASRLEEQRLVAMESWAEAELGAGRHREIVADLERLIDEHPLREGLWGLLMLALYRSGRQAEALRAYAGLKQRLGEELGIEPSRELAALEHQMLMQDPSVDAPRRLAPKVARPRSHWAPIAGATVAVAVLAIAITAVLLRSDTGTGPKVGSRYLVAQGTTEIVAAGDSVWLLDPTDQALTRVDPETGTTTRHELDVPPSTMAAGLGALWVSSEVGRTVLKVDPYSGNTLGAAGGLDLRGADLAVADDAVIIVREHLHPFLSMDPVTLDVETVPFVDGFGGPAEPSITIDDGVVWGANSFIGRILTLDPDSGEFDFAGDPASSEHSVRGVLSNRGLIWYSQPTNGSVTAVDSRSLEVEASAQVGENTSAGYRPDLPRYGMANGPGGVWIALPDDGRVVLLDDETAAVVTGLDFDRPVSVTATVGRLWVLDAGTGQLIEVIPGVCDETPFIGPGADLRGCDFTDKTFIGLDLSGVDLRWSRVTPSALQNVDFSGADLYGADLTFAGTEGINWSAARCPDGSLSDLNGGTCVGHLRP